MPVADDSTLADLLHIAAPEPPDELLDIATLRTRVRRRHTVRVASLAASVVTLAAGLATILLLHSIGATTSPTRITSTPSPTTPPPVAGDVIVTTNCRAHVIDGQLVAPFDLDSTDRFDPPSPAIRPAHTIAQVLAAYRAGSHGSAHPGSKPQVFLATHSMSGVRATRQVWAVVTYHVTGAPAMGPSPARTTKTDEIAAFDAATLHPLWVLYAMPIVCE